jgi:AraC-like DNA-binding protein
MIELLPFSFSKFSSILLFFFINGGIICSLLIGNWVQTKSRSSVWLVGFTLLCMLYISPFMLGYAGWYSKELPRTILFYAPLQQLLLIGPVIYFYVRSLLVPTLRFEKINLIHFLPALLYNIAMVVVFLNDIVFDSSHFFYADGKDMDLDPWYQWAGLFSMLGYLILSVLHYQKFKKAIFDAFSFAEEMVVNWVQHFLISFIIILVLRVLFFVLNPEWGEFGNKFWYYFCFSVLFTYIGFKGYLHALKQQLKASFKDQNELEVHQLLTDTLGDAYTENDRSKVSSNSLDVEVEKWVNELDRLMKNEFMYKNSQLTISDFADKLETHTKQISSVVNTGFGMNFNDWVNKHRVEEVIKQIDEGQLETKTMLALALEAGFNSKSTFNRSFKKYKGITPVQYVKGSNM